MRNRLCGYAFFWLAEPVTSGRLSGNSVLNCRFASLVNCSRETSIKHIGAVLLGYYTDDRLHYAGCAGMGITDKELKRLAGVLKPLHVPKMPLAAPPRRDSRFGSPQKLSKVRWVKSELVVEVTYLTWTEDNLLRKVSYQGQRKGKPARQMVRPVPHPPTAYRLREMATQTPPGLRLGRRSRHVLPFLGGDTKHAGNGNA
jgi:hypothetical protein